jgi:hypothetical protein
VWAAARFLALWAMFTSEKYCRFASRKLLRRNGPRFGGCVPTLAHLENGARHRGADVPRLDCAAARADLLEAISNRLWSSFDSAAVCMISNETPQDRKWLARCPCDPHINIIDIKRRYFSFVKIDCRHTLMTTPDRRADSRRMERETRTEATG